MKKLWKILGITALAAAVPIRVKKDETTGTKKYQSLLLSVDVGPGENGEGTDVGINLGEGVIGSAISSLIDAKKEAELFADDEPEAAMLDADELQVIAEEAQEAAEEAQEAAGEAQEAAGEAQEAAGETQAIADEAAEAFDTDPAV